MALDYAVQTIRSGRSKVAVAAGTSLILSPGENIHCLHLPFPDLQHRDTHSQSDDKKRDAESITQ